MHDYIISLIMLAEMLQVGCPCVQQSLKPLSESVSLAAKNKRLCSSELCLRQLLSSHAVTLSLSRMPLPNSFALISLLRRCCTCNQSWQITGWRLSGSPSALSFGLQSSALSFVATVSAVDRQLYFLQAVLVTVFSMSYSLVLQSVLTIWQSQYGVHSICCSAVWPCTRFCDQLIAYDRVTPVAHRNPM